MLILTLLDDQWIDVYLGDKIILSMSVRQTSPRRNRMIFDADKKLTVLRRSLGPPTNK